MTPIALTPDAPVPLHSCNTYFIFIFVMIPYPCSNCSHDIRYLGRAIESELEFEKVLSRRATDTQALSGRGRARHALGNVSGAFEDFNEAIVLDPSRSEFYQGRGQAFLKMKLFSESRSDLDEALLRDPVNVIALIDRGKVCIALRLYDQATLDLKNAAALEPSIPLTLFAIAQAFGVLKRYQDAHPIYDRLVRGDNTANFLFGSLVGRGCSSFSLGDTRDWEKDLNRAIKLCPEEFEGWFTRGTLFHATGRYKDALSDLDRALRVRPSVGTATFVRTLTLNMLERSEEALLALDRCSRSQDPAWQPGLDLKFILDSKAACRLAKLLEMLAELEVV